MMPTITPISNGIIWLRVWTTLSPDKPPISILAPKKIGGANMPHL
jgi:hypothetical protein